MMGTNIYMLKKLIIINRLGKEQKVVDVIFLLD